MYVRWLDAIEDFRFDVTHPPGARNRCRDADSRAATAPRRRRATRAQRVGRSSSLASVATHPRPALLAAIRVGWAHTRRAAAAAFANVQNSEGDAHPSTPLGVGAVLNPPVH